VSDRSWGGLESTDSPLCKLLEQVTPEDVVGIELPTPWHRTVIHSRPALSVLWERTDAGPKLHNISMTPCVRCSEARRATLTILENVKASDEPGAWLEPGLRLDVGPWIAQHPSLARTNWFGALSQFLDSDPMVVQLLREATVVEEDHGTVHLRYPDGRRDTWSFAWFKGGWALQYHRLAPDSPLRLDGAEIKKWRRLSRRTRAWVENWTPSWASRGGGLGVSVARNTVGAAFDELDGTLVIAMLDMDRAQSGVFRVDPATRDGRTRIALPGSGARGHVRTGPWFDRWPTALHPDGTVVAMTSPGALWTIDLSKGTAQMRERIHWVRELSWPYIDGEPRLMRRTDRSGMVTLDAVWMLRLPAPAIATLMLPDRIEMISHDGTLWRFGPGERTPHQITTFCGGRPRDAAASPLDGTWVVSCADEAPIGHQRLAPYATEPESVGDAGSPYLGVMWSPDGRMYTTPAPSSLRAPLWIWSAASQEPIAAVRTAHPVVSVTFSRDMSELLTVDTKGEAILWDLPGLLRAFTPSAPVPLSP